MLIVSIFDSDFFLLQGNNEGTELAQQMRVEVINKVIIAYYFLRWHSDDLPIA